MIRPSLVDIVAELRASEPADLVEGAFFLEFSDSATATIAETLVGHYWTDSFSTMYAVFPDHAKCMNDNYCMHALNFLIHLHETDAIINWLPAWLGQGNSLTFALESFMESCLSYFATDPTRRNILLCAAGLRRLFKALLVVDESVWNVGNIMHVITRYVAPENAWSQMLSSPERQNLLRLDGMTNFALYQLVRECSDERGQPKSELIEISLRELWEAEARIVESVSSYSGLLRARRMEERQPTEAMDVVYDYLGHSSLCIVSSHPKWKMYILKHHKHYVEMLAGMGSGQARNWLRYDEKESILPLDDRSMASRFFLDDLDMYRRLRSAYGYD